jgi:4-aminobutyrate aminotransferase
MAIRLKQVPGSKSSKLSEFYRRYNALSTHEYPLAIKDGQGAYIQDVDGNWFLDFNSQIASAALGYKHPEVMHTIKEHSDNGAMKIAGQFFYCEEAAELTRNILSIAPKKMRRVFLANSGTEAVENCMKLIWRKVGPLPGVSCSGAFHGSTIGSLSITHARAAYKKNYPEISHHTIKFCTRDDDTEIDELEKFILTGGKPSFVIVEPVQGNSGYYPASKKFMQVLSKITKINKVPLICDEVQSGMGRTGKWWAFQNYNIEPDFIAAGKHLQVGAVIFPNEFNPAEKGAVLSTWGGGHRLDMAIASTVIKTIRKQKLLENAVKIGEQIRKKLKDLAKELPKFIIDTRGIGLMQAVEFPSAEIRDKIIQQAFRNGLCLLPAGERTVRIAPPLIIKKEEAEEGLNVLEKVVKNSK